MKKESFEINQLYILESTCTNRPYINEDGGCIVFLHLQDAKAKQEATEKTRVSEPKYYKLDSLCGLCYAAGADYITVVSGEEESKLELSEDHLKPGAYNHMLNSVLAQIKQTQKKKYVYFLAKCDFIVPAKVENGEEVKLYYSIAKHQVSEFGQLYVAFSGLSEFTAWALDVPGWQPLMVDFKGLCRIGAKDGVILNPFGNQLIITKELFADIIRYEADKAVNIQQTKGEES